MSDSLTPGRRAQLAYGESSRAHLKTVDEFMREYDEGKHPLSAEDEAAMRRAESSFRSQLYAKFKRPVPAE